MQDEPDPIFAVEILDRNHLHMTRAACTVERKTERFPAFRDSRQRQTQRPQGKRLDEDDRDI
jgi:hypothetical protein